MSRSVTVVVIQSPSYTGTTWINLLLACHERAFAVGPPNRVLDLLEEGPEKGGDACRVHGADCPFWPAFFEQYDREGNFYLQLAEASGRDVIVINNPTAGGVAERHLAHPRVLIKRVCVVRDARSVIASYGRYHPGADFLDTIRSWLLPFAAVLCRNQDDPEVLLVRHEDVLDDQRAFLDRAGAFLDVEYPEHAVRFWEFDHHPPSGNPGPLATVARYQGRPFTGVDAELRETKYERLLADPHHPVAEARWPNEWTDRDRLMFDYYAGELNESWGYPRDRFTSTEVRRFEEEIGSSPPVHVVYHPPTQRLRAAFRAHTLKLHGLFLTPRQVRFAGGLSLAFYVLSLVIIALVGAVVF